MTRAPCTGYPRTILTADMGGLDRLIEAVERAVSAPGAPAVAIARLQALCETGAGLVRAEIPGLMAVAPADLIVRFEPTDELLDLLALCGVGLEGEP